MDLWAHYFSNRFSPTLCYAGGVTSRIDVMLTTQNLVSQCINITHQQHPISNHGMVFTKVKLSAEKFLRRPYPWFFPNELLDRELALQVVGGLNTLEHTCTFQNAAAGRK